MINKLEICGLTKRFGEKTLFEDLDLTLAEPAILWAPSGWGKTTLLRLLLGELEPTEGSIRHGTRLEVSYFDQLRSSLDPEKSVMDNVANGNDTVTINGQQRHVASYLMDFLFESDRLRVPVHTLSGGERNRLLLAKLFTMPSNLLVLDEPTNDLDIDSLELLEETLENYPGTVILVSHDRRFLDSVVTQVLAPVNYLAPDGRWMEFAGGYEDWVRQRPAIETPETGAVPDKPAAKKPVRQRAERMSWKENKELETLPETIEALESEQEVLMQKMSSADFFRLPVSEQQAVTARSEALTQEIETAYERWEFLTQKAQSCAKN